MAGPRSALWADIRRYDGHLREIVAYTLLFETFHRYIADLDRHINDQLAAGDQPIPAPFGREVIRALSRRGFGARESEQFLAVFFQFRRAYFFIEARLVGDSPCMQSLRTALWNNVFTRDVFFYKENLLGRMDDFSTLLLGETGTGKGSAAAAIGRPGFIPYDPSAGKFVEAAMERGG